MRNQKLHSLGGLSGSYTLYLILASGLLIGLVIVRSFLLALLLGDEDVDLATPSVEREPCRLPSGREW